MSSIDPKTTKINEKWICMILPEGFSRENTVKRITYDLMVQTIRFFNRNVGVKKSKKYFNSWSKPLDSLTEMLVSRN